MKTKKISRIIHFALVTCLATSFYAQQTYIEYDSAADDPALQLHETSNDASHITFSNDQFPNNRFFIRADPSTTGAVNAAMRLGWGSIGTSANDIIVLDGSTNHVGIGVDPYESFRLHVEGPQAAAHFGPQSASFPAVGYVTVNRPAGNSSVEIFKIRNEGSTVADFNESEINLRVPTVIRDNVDIIGGDLDVSGTISASCGMLSCSDIRYKKNIAEIPSVLEKLTKISGVYYDWDTDNFSDMGFTNDRQVGVIAQELEAVFPELVQTKDDGYKVVAYDKLAPIVLQAVKEQQDIIEQLKADNTLIKKQVAALMAKLK